MIGSLVPVGDEYILKGEGVLCFLGAELAFGFFHPQFVI